MTTHPEAAMTREQVLKQQIQAELNNISYEDYDGVHYIAVHEAMEIFTAALASTRQEPAPAADAEEVARELAAVARRYRTHEVALSSRQVANVLDDFADVLRARASGEKGGVK